MTGIAENHQSSLPQKENALFKRLLKMYEQKQYKTALKIAKQILSNPKCAEHGETLAMRGLTLNYLGRKEEAYEDVKRGLKSDIKSYVCWHVYGLLQRGDKKYEDALKCYVNALKFDKDNIQILRDLATLQIQLRDLEGFRDTRYKLAVLRPTQRSHWLAYAVALHLQGDVLLAIRVMEECRKLAHPDKFEDCDVEYGEYILYQIDLMLEAGHFQDAIDHSLRYESYVYDHVALLEGRAKACLHGNRIKDSNDILISLIQRNSENWSYYQQLTFPLDDKCPDLLSFCRTVQASEPNSRTAFKIPLTLTQGDQFRDLVKDYLWRGLQKGIPSLFNDVKILYNDQEKATVIEDVIKEFFERLKSDDPTQDVTAEENEPPASTLLWLFYFLAQHYDQKKDFAQALQFVNFAIEHTPTLVEAYSFKAKIFKHLGQFEEAANCMDEAQSLDTSDRYINYKAGKYMLRANLTERAENILSKFTREGVKASDILCDMQCFWYMTESARAFRRLGKFGEALRLLHVIDRHFMDIVDDQLDFHAYCLRKSTIRSYVTLIRTEDTIRQHKFYVDAAVLAAQIYLQLHEKQPADSDDDEANMDPALSATERRKAKNKQRKAKKKAENERVQQEALEKNKNQSKVKKDDDEPIATQKDDLIPEKLAKPDDPLEEACRFLRPLLTLDIARADLHETTFLVYFRKGKLALALKSLLKLMDLDPSHKKLGEYQTMCSQFGQPVNGGHDSVHDIAQEALLAVKSFVLQPPHVPVHSLDNSVPV